MAEIRSKVERSPFQNEVLIGQLSTLAHIVNVSLSLSLLVYFFLSPHDAAISLSLHLYLHPFSTSVCRICYIIRRNYRPLYYLIRYYYLQCKVDCSS